MKLSIALLVLLSSLHCSVVGAAEQETRWSVFPAEASQKLVDRGGRLGATLTGVAGTLKDGTSVIAARIVEIQPYSFLSTTELQQNNIIYAIDNYLFGTLDGMIKYVQSIQEGDFFSITFRDMEKPSSYTLRLKMESQSSIDQKINIINDQRRYVGDMAKLFGNLFVKGCITKAEFEGASGALSRIAAVYSPTINPRRLTDSLRIIRDNAKDHADMIEKIKTGKMRFTRENAPCW